MIHYSVGISIILGFLGILALGEGVGFQRLLGALSIILAIILVLQFALAKARGHEYLIALGRDPKTGEP